MKLINVLSEKFVKTLDDHPYHRDLKTFEVNIENSIRLRNFFKKENIFVAESGIKNQKDIDKLSMHNINVFLIGESLMRGDFL